MSTSPSANNDQLRRNMVKEQLLERGISDARVLNAMSSVRRHHFVPARFQHMAYDDGPLPIGANQTISQPYIVALMTELLHLRGDEYVLEVGVGSGYQTAILSLLAKEVVGLELIPELAQQASQRLGRFEYDNVTIHVGDGSQGLPDQAPFDAILVAAASPGVPEPLMAQLADGGRMIIPVTYGKDQTLERINKQGGTLHIEPITPVRFVPLLGKHGFRKHQN